MVKRKRNILTLGQCGFPHGTASIQKLGLMGRAMLGEHVTFTVISNTFLKKNKLNQTLTRRGNYQGINYLTTSPYIFSPKTKTLKLYAKIVGFVKEFIWVISRLSKIDAIILYSYKYIYIVFWSLISKMFNIPVYLVYFELRSSHSTTKSYFDKINDELLDEQSFKYVTGIFTISEELIKQIQKFSPNKPCFIIPPLVDFNSYDKIPVQQESFRNYLFCGSVGYNEIIDFIITSFKLIESKLFNARLTLIINGNEDEIENYRNKIEIDRLESRIIIRSGLTNEELILAYKSAYALLIPLRNTKQDIARLPHKIAEYCASKRPIIATPFGDIIKYLDEDSIFYCKDYSVEAYSEMMEFVYENKGLADQVGERSYIAGKKYFDYKSYSEKLLDFMNIKNGL